MNTKVYVVLSESSIDYEGEATTVEGVFASRELAIQYVTQLIEDMRIAYLDWYDQPCHEENRKRAKEFKPNVLQELGDYGCVDVSDIDYNADHSSIEVHEYLLQDHLEPEKKEPN